MGTNLRERVQANAAAGGGQAGTDVATRENDTEASLAHQINAMSRQFQLAMPQGAEATQLVRDALTCLRKTPKLAEAHAPTVLGALMTCAQLGLRPGVLGQAWVLPFWNGRAEWVDTRGRTRKGRMEAQLVIGYQGYLELSKRSGLIDTLIARPVHENDDFDIDYGIADNLIHKPRIRGDRGEIIGYYSIVKYTTGGYAFWYMNREEVEQHRDRFAMTKSKEGRIFGPWVDHFDAMALKTVFLRLVRWMPKDTEMARAVHADERVRLDLGDPRDMDKMLEGPHPVLDVPADDTPPIVDVGAAPVTDAPDGPEQYGGDVPAPDAGAGGSGTPSTVGGALQTEFPAVVGQGSDAPALTSQQKKIHTLLSRGGVTSDNDAARHAVLARMIGLGRPLATASSLTKREAAQIDELLSTWDSTGRLTEQLAAVVEACRTAGLLLPEPGTKPWHDAGHPTRRDDGTVSEPVDTVLDGSCGICEQPEDAPQTQ